MENQINDKYREINNGSERRVYDFGLIGFWYTQNYGAALTSYALAETVKIMGHSVLMIDAPGTEFPEAADVYDPDSSTRRFISERFDISDRQDSYYELQKLNDICDGFILGSDQLWGWYPGKYHDFGAYYILDFVSGRKKKIAYGTSFGKTEFNGNYDDRTAFGYMLRRFSDVSVREIDGKDLCAKEFGVNATWVVDPVFLLSAEDYRTIGKESTLVKEVQGKDYIFVYLLQPTKEKNRIIREFSEKLGKEIIAVGDLWPDISREYSCDEWEFEHYSKIEVADWIRLLEGSSFVITDSFHGFCFSIIFKKQFIALTPRGALNRFQTIARLTGLEKRIDAGGSNKEYSNLSPIDYEFVRSKLEPEIIRSRQWLEQVLKKPYAPKETDILYDMMRYDYLRVQKELAMLRNEYEIKLDHARSQYFSMSCKLRRQSYITRRYIVRDYLMRRLANKCIALRGAGGHSTEVIRILTDTDIRVSCIWDQNVEFDSFEGYPVIKSASELQEKKVEAVLISSWKHRKGMAEDIKEEFKQKDITDIEVVDFYEELNDRGIPIDSEYFWFDWDEIE